MSMLLISSELRPVAWARGPDHRGVALDIGLRIRRCPQSVLVVMIRNPLTNRRVIRNIRENLMPLNSAPVTFVTSGTPCAPAPASLPWTRRYRSRNRPPAAFLLAGAAAPTAPVLPL